MLDNLVELIVFTPRGSFNCDPDFGFEYWNHEYSNVHYREFNNEQGGLFNEITKKECQESIMQSLAIYAPQLKQVQVSMELNSAETETQWKEKVPSKYLVAINVIGKIAGGLGTSRDYTKSVKFLMEPTVKII